MRNSPLVEGSCAENVTGLKFAAEAVDVQVQGERNGSETGTCSQGKADVKDRNLWLLPGHGRGAFLGRRR